MLTLTAKHWYSWDFTLLKDQRVVADLGMSAWREKGTLTVEGVEHRVFRERVLGGDFVIEAAGRTLARAAKPSAFRNTLRITRDQRTYLLRKRSIWRNEFVLLDGEREIGSIARKSFWTRQATVALPEDWPLPTRAFVIWLVLMLWKRDADNGA